MQYVSEEHNPENAKGVAGVEVFVPSPLLADGMCFVDTPGLGSIFAGNTAATQAFVPHIDAAIIVVGADPPIAGEELALVEEVGKQVQHLLVVLNKADRTSDEERRAAVPFTRKILEKRLGRAMGPIYEISAYQRLSKNETHWDWDALLAALQKLVDESGRTLVREAGERGLQRLAEEMLSVTLEEREALVRPIEESERRIAAMRETIAETERSLREIGYLFMAEKHRLSDLFLERRNKFLNENLTAARGEARAEFLKIRRRYGPKFRRDAMHSAQTIAAHRVLPWLTKEQASAEEEYRKVARRFVNIGNEFLQKLSESRIPGTVPDAECAQLREGFPGRLPLPVRGVNQCRAARVTAAVSGGRRSWVNRRVFRNPEGCNGVFRVSAGDEQLASAIRCDGPSGGKSGPIGGGNSQTAARSDAHRD